MAEQQVEGQITDHAFSLHSRRPFTCRICKRGAELHTSADQVSQVTWRDAKTADVTDRMKAYGDRTVNALRTLASLPTIVQWDLGKGRGLHATAIKILTKDGIITDTAPGEPASTWVISPVGLQLCFHFGIEVNTGEAEAETVVEIPALRKGVTAEQYAAAQADTHAAATAMMETATAWVGNVAEDSTELDASDIAEGIAQAWAEAGSPRDDQGQPVIPVCVHCGHATVGRDDQVTPFPHECVTAEDLARFTGKPVIPTDVDALRAEHDAAMAEWVKPLVAMLPTRTLADRLHDELDGPSPFVLPLRTPGAMLSNLDIVTAHDEAWQREESAIWAGTESLGSMRVRLPRKVKKATYRIKHRPIDVKRARIASGSVR